MDIQRDGAGYKAVDGGNLLASTDEWMSPIFADIGPDGAVWVIDFYSFIIQHNPTPSLQSAGVQATTGRGGAYQTENNLRDQSHGRIYRVVWKDGPRSAIPSLAKKKSPEVVAALESGNPFWSLTAQRLIVDNKMVDAAPALKKRVRSGAGGKGAIHALWSLEGIGELDQDTHRAALLSKDAALRRNAIRALPANDHGQPLFFSSPVIQDPDLLTRQVALVKLLEFPTIPEIQTVVAQLSRVPIHSSDTFLNNTLTLLGRIHKVSGVGENEVQVAAGDKVKVGGKELTWRNVTAATNYLDFNETLKSINDHVAGYLVTYIECDADTPDVVIAVASNDQGRIYFNGVDIYAFTEPHPLMLDADKGKVTLKKGTNVMVFKITNEQKAWQGAMRLLDRSGAPLKNIRLKLQP